MAPSRSICPIQAVLDKRAPLRLGERSNAGGKHEPISTRGADVLKVPNLLPGASPPTGLEVPVWSETEVPGLTTAVEHALRLLARLLVKASVAAQSEPAAVAQKPLDVAAAPKVGLDRE